jgi:hypothetical protein
VVPVVVVVVDVKEAQGEPPPPVDVEEARGEPPPPVDVEEAQGEPPPLLAPAPAPAPPPAPALGDPVVLAPVRVEGIMSWGKGKVLVD